jgi:hypothetical protein
VYTLSFAGRKLIEILILSLDELKIKISMLIFFMGGHEREDKAD